MRFTTENTRIIKHDRILEINKYPIYIPTKGRFKSRKTVRALQGMGASFRVVIESQEYDLYSKILSKEKIIVLPYSKPKVKSKLVRNNKIHPGAITIRFPASTRHIQRK